jgi:hypothetical protein
MTSLRQIEANRRNANRSTGPNTEEGMNLKSQNTDVRRLHEVLSEQVMETKQEHLCAAKSLCSAILLRFLS